MYTWRAWAVDAWRKPLCGGGAKSAAKVARIRGKARLGRIAARETFPLPNAPMNIS